MGGASRGIVGVSRKLPSSVRRTIQREDIICVTYISGTGLSGTIHKKYLQLDNEKTNIQIKMGKEF